MEVGSVNSGSSAYASANLRANEGPKAEEARETQKPQRNEAKEAEPVKAKENAPQTAPQAKVNAQGQQTGTTISVTA